MPDPTLEYASPRRNPLPPRFRPRRLALGILFLCLAAIGFYIAFEAYAHAPPLVLLPTKHGHDSTTDSLWSWFLGGLCTGVALAVTGLTLYVTAFPPRRAPVHFPRK